MKQLLKFIIIVLIVIVGASSCSEQRKKNDEARELARKMVEMVLAVDTVQPVDSFALENVILLAKAVESEYQLNGEEETAEVFSEAFEEALSERAPNLAAQLFDAEER